MLPLVRPMELKGMEDIWKQEFWQLMQLNKKTEKQRQPRSQKQTQR